MRWYCMGLHNGIVWAGLYIPNSLYPFVHVVLVCINAITEVVNLFNGFEEMVIKVFLEHKLHLVWWQALVLEASKVEMQDGS